MIEKCGEYLIAYMMEGSIETGYCHIAPEKLDKVIKNLKKDELEIAFPEGNITLKVSQWRLYTLGIFKKNKK